MKKKIFLLAAVTGLFLLLTGCVGSKTTSTLEFTDKNGAGTKTIVFEIPQDAETVVEVKENDDGTTTTDYTIYNNSSYFPKGYEAFADWVISQLPDKGYTYTIDKSDASNIYLNFTYSFTSFADYAEKTKALVGDERWTYSEFVDPQLYVTKVEDPADSNYGKIKLTFAESHYLTAACVNTILEVGFSEAAVEAGVFAPFGDVATNPDAKAKYKDANTTDTWRQYCINTYMAQPDNVCDDESGPRTYIFEGETHVENQGKDGMISLYVEDDGTWTLTDPMPEILGKKGIEARNPKVLDENGDPVKNEYGGDMSPFEVYAPEDGASWIIIVVIIAVVAVAAVVVIAVIIKKRNDEYEDDDEDDEDEDDEDEDEDDEE